MPTPLKKILQGYSEQDLESFARDKIDDFEHLRLPKSVLIDELYSLFTDASYLKEKLAFRAPPSYDILHVLLNSKGYEHEINDFKNKVLKKTDELVTRTETEDRIGSGENYDLYVRMLRTAWHNDDEIKQNEADLLETLRSELSITFEEHFILEHHQDIKDLWDHGSPFKRERNHLLQSGILFTGQEENKYVVPEEIAHQVLDLWGIELDHEDYSRLLDYFKKSELSLILEKFGLHISGTKDVKIDRIIENHIPVSSALEILKKTHIREVCKKVGCKSSGSKSQIIDHLIQYVQYDRDLESEEDTEDQVTLPVEEKDLEKKEFENLFQSFNSSQIYEVLSEIPTKPVYGTKDERIERLWQCTLSEKSLLEMITKDVLREACEEFNLPVSGTKNELISRLIDHQKEIDVEESESQSEVPQDQSDGQDGEVDYSEIPNFDRVVENFSFLNTQQQAMLASLIEFESISEQEIDRIVARYDLPWIFPNQEMEQLMKTLQENGYEIIKKNEVEDHNWYKIKKAEELSWAQ